MVKALKRTVFVGTFRHTVDEKKRLAIPAKWRAAAKGAQEFYVLPHPQEHLIVLPEGAMDKMLERVDDISIGEYKRRNTLRLITGDAHGTPCDSQGRITLTSELMKRAGIESEVVLVGVLKGFEIWSPRKFDEAMQSASTDFAESAKELGI
jgi:MraZ protein